MCGRVYEGVCLEYIYKGRGTRDGSVLIKDVLCTNMYPNIHVIMLNDRIRVA